MIAEYISACVDEGTLLDEDGEWYESVCRLVLVLTSLSEFAP